LKIVVSKDGSNTIYSDLMDEFYHSPRGAISESKYVFIENGLEEYYNLFKYSSISILEIGLGTGLNALLAWEFSNEFKVNIDYIGIEKFPLEKKLNFSLNYSDTNKEVFNKIVFNDWNQKIEIDQFFSLSKIESDISNFDFNSEVDIVFFDAFAKSKQNEIWDDEIIYKVANFIKKDGFFVTYASTSQLKKQLKNLNFDLFKRKGALGKREMTLAQKK
jgi:tRNA U34 5-methylaminomethyl-2-thiouridine-forming methyltransferase MnmC